MTVPREADFYWPSIHSIQQKKTRDIDWDLVATTLENGEIHPSHKQDCKLFIKDFAHTEYPVGVVASYKTGRIVTVEWRYDC